MQPLPFETKIMGKEEQQRRPLAISLCRMQLLMSGPHPSMGIFSRIVSGGDEEDPFRR